jgi:hypothetical protein
VSADVTLPWFGGRSGAILSMGVVEFFFLGRKGGMRRLVGR